MNRVASLSRRIPRWPNLSSNSATLLTTIRKSCIYQFWQTCSLTQLINREVAGQWIALLPLSYAAWSMGLNILVMWPGWIAAFALFRLFDIWKPLLVGWADRRGDALGVMLDDVIAGVFALICVIALAGLYHGLL